MIAKAVIVPATAQTAWLREILSDRSPAELPLAGQRIVDYALESAERFGIREVEVFDARFSAGLDAFFKNRARTQTATAARYARLETPPPEGLDGLVAALGGERALAENLSVTWGLGLPRHAPGFDAAERVPAEGLAWTAPGFYRWKDGGWWPFR